MPVAVIVLAAGQGTPDELGPAQGPAPARRRAAARPRAGRGARARARADHRRHRPRRRGGRRRGARHRPRPARRRSRPSSSAPATRCSQAAPELAGFAGDVVVLYGDTPFIRPETLAGDARRPRRRRRRGGARLRGRRPRRATAGCVLDAAGGLAAIVEARDATPDQLAIRLCNSGLARRRRRHPRSASSPRCGNDNAKGEYYLTDIVALARARGLAAAAITCPEAETLGINSRAELAAAEAAFQARARAEAMENGATLTDPARSSSRSTPWSAATSLIGPNVVFGPDVTVESGATIHAFCHLEGCHVSRGARIGPFARLRPGRRARRGRACRQLRRDQERHRRGGRQGQPPDLYRRRRASAPAPTSAPAPSPATTTASSSTAPTIGARAFIGSNIGAGRAGQHRRRRADRRRLGHHRRRARRARSRSGAAGRRPSPASGSG